MLALLVLLLQCSVPSGDAAQRPPAPPAPPAPDAATEPKPEPQPEAKEQAQPEPKPEPKLEVHAEPPPLPFSRGTSMGGVLLGFASGAGESQFIFGASYGYFVLNGVAPGLSTVVTASTVYPTTVELAPFVRIVPWRAYPVSPMLVVKGGRLFVDGQDDLWLVGGGGGLVIFASHRVGFLIEALYLQYFPDTLCNPCDRTLVSAGVGVFY